MEKENVKKSRKEKEEEFFQLMKNSTEKLKLKNQILQQILEQLESKDEEIVIEALEYFGIFYTETKFYFSLRHLVPSKGELNDLGIIRKIKTILDSNNFNLLNEAIICMNIICLNHENIREFIETSPKLIQLLHLKNEILSFNIYTFFKILLSLNRVMRDYLIKLNIMDHLFQSLFYITTIDGFQCVNSCFSTIFKFSLSSEREFNEIWYYFKPTMKYKDNNSLILWLNQFPLFIQTTFENVGDDCCKILDENRIFIYLINFLYHSNDQIVIETLLALSKSIKIDSVKYFINSGILKALSYIIKHKNHLNVESIFVILGDLIELDIDSLVNMISFGIIEKTFEFLSDNNIKYQLYALKFFNIFFNLLDLKEIEYFISLGILEIILKNSENRIIMEFYQMIKEKILVVIYLN